MEQVNGNQHNSPADVVLGKLESVQGRAPHWRAICPAHESKHRSRTLSLHETDDGRLLLKCHAGCGVAAITSAIGVDLADLFPAGPGSDEHRAPRVRKPWSAREVAAALRGELSVAFILLADLRAGKPLTDADRQRASMALDRIVIFLDAIDDV